ncbi:MAG: hypothetical protein HRT47_08700 [Candidatus Caenarcaniphilales bacterium]|nr:hypothetical protein [Candidatus Caenarcaniphilales bacterium]
MGSRGMNLGSDIDNVSAASEEELDAILKKFTLTKNCKPDTALRWALQRAMDEATRNKIRAKLEAYYKDATGLL